MSNLLLLIFIIMYYKMCNFSLQVARAIGMALYAFDTTWFLPTPISEEEWCFSFIVVSLIDHEKLWNSESTRGRIWGTKFIYFDSVT